jgi:toxin YoeB
MDIAFSKNAWEDYQYWQKHDKRIHKKINELIRDISRSPYSGIGSPEALKHNLEGYYSRRINLEHRLVYRVVNHQIRIIQCRYHY